MGWLRLAGSLKLWVSFAESSLQGSFAKETYVLREPTKLDRHCISSSNGSTGWRRPIGCLKLQVIFRKRAPSYMPLLRKMTYEDKASYDSTLLCIELTFERFGKFSKVCCLLLLRCILPIEPTFDTFSASAFSSLLEIIGLFCKRAL